MRFHPFSCGRMVKGGMHCTKNSSSVSGSGDIYTQDAEKEAKEEKVDIYLSTISTAFFRFLNFSHREHCCGT